MSTDTALPELTPTTALSVETVQSVHHWNEHLFSFSVSRPDSFRFRSGEFVMIGLQGDNGKPLLRAYSVASPSYDEKLDFLSIKVEDGPLTSKLQKVQPGDNIYLGRKPTGTLVADALLPGKRLFMLSTGTGLAPFLSVARDPDIYDMFDEVVIVHSVRRVSDLAFHDELVGKLADDPLVGDVAANVRSVLAALQHDVRRERVEALGDAPNVQVVHLRHAVARENGALYRRDVEVRRRRFQQDGRCFLEDAEAADRDQHRYARGQQWIGAIPTPECNSQASEHGADRADCVHQHVRERRS